MNILICTIIRNQETKLINWYNQLSLIVKNNPDLNFFLSVYENNSSDNTKNILKSLNFTFFEKSSIVSEDLETAEFFRGGYEPYGEESKRRVKLLSECRNKTLSVDFLNESDFILFVEPDIVFDYKIFKDIFNFMVGNQYDVTSAISVGSGEHYDKWGTRLIENDTWCNLTEFIGSENKIDLHSTFNCFVLYKSEPFIKYNCRFGFFSDFLNSHDCDTVVICNELRKNGYNKICILPNKIINHFF